MYDSFGISHEKIQCIVNLVVMTGKREVKHPFFSLGCNICMFNL